MKGKNIILWSITFIAILTIMFAMCCLDSPATELAKLIAPVGIAAAWLWAFYKANYN